MGLPGCLCSFVCLSSFLYLRAWMCVSLYVCACVQMCPCIYVCVRCALHWAVDVCTYAPVVCVGGWHVRVSACGSCINHRVSLTAIVWGLRCRSRHSRRRRSSMRTRARGHLPKRPRLLLSHGTSNIIKIPKTASKTMARRPTNRYAYLRHGHLPGAWSNANESRVTRGVRHVSAPHSAPQARVPLPQVARGRRADRV